MRKRRAHGSLFPSKRANRWVGRLAGLLVLSPFERWRHDHPVHHVTSGDLERRGVGDIVTLEDAYWQSAGDWDYTEVALRGSSYLKLPRLLDFFTGHIGFHHVHHFNARIPNYNLQRLTAKTRSSMRYRRCRC